jgi:septal ring factor EnvC (AmiA/AmiB activator)
MRRARRSSLLTLLPLTLLLMGQAGPGDVPPGVPPGVPPVAPPSREPIGREDAARRQVEDAERVRSMQVDAQRAATEQAAQALAEEQRLTAAQSEAFERLKRAEAAVDEMTRHMLDLNQRRAEAQNRIDKRVAALRPLLPAVVRMSEYPVETLLGARVPAEDAIRGILVLRTIARQAQADARSLAEDRQALDEATKAAAEVAPRLAAAEAARAIEVAGLARELADAKDRLASAEQDAADAARRAAAEAARADSLRSMLEILETQRRLEEARAREDVLRAERDQKAAAADAARMRQAALSRPTGAGTLSANAKPAGQLTRPVAGKLLRGWGDPEDGEPATGQSWQTEPGARVVAPCGGTIAFAEPFHGYGLLVIIDCGGGYNAVVSGLDQLAVVPGRAIQDGDPLGTMKAAAKGDAAPAEPPVLYIELRKAGRPVDPAPWLTPMGQ